MYSVALSDKFENECRSYLMWCVGQMRWYKESLLLGLAQEALRVHSYKDALTNLYNANK